MATQTSCTIGFKAGKRRFERQLAKKSSLQLGDNNKDFLWHADSKQQDKNNIISSMKENKMKPRRIQKHTGSNWQGKSVSPGDKAALSQAKPAHVSSPVQVKPFAGKVFYLDLPSNRTAETLENDIKDLGGTVEKFFSKDIKYLVSNKREARYVHCLRQDSPVPSPDSGPSSPHPQPSQHRPGSNGDNIKSRSQGQTDTFVPSRGKSLVERVVKEQERVKINKILSNALEWGVKILYIDDILAYVQKKKKRIGGQCPATTALKTSVKAESAAKQALHKYKGGRISKPFIKVEDSSRHYRPIYITMSDMPEFNLQTVPPCTPFCVEDKNPPGNKQQGHRGAKASASEERGHGRKKRDKKRGGYCECCMVKYENITAHLKSERHKAFSKSDEYLVLDKLVSNLQCNFIDIGTQVHRPKCSVSSALFVPGPYPETVQRHKGDVDSTEIIKDVQHQTVDGQQGSCPGQVRPARSVPGLAPPTHREGGRRSFDTHSGRSKHKSVARKRPCRQNSLTSCTQKAEQAESPQPTMETAPPRGDCPPSRVTLAQIMTQDVTNSPFHCTNIENEASSSCLNVATNQQVESDQKHSSGSEVQDGNISPDKMTGNNQSQCEEANVPAQTFSPLRKIQRKARVYKRKRRKVETCVERLKPGDIHDNSMQKLWDLFLSSDDMDVDFLGFED